MQRHVETLRDKVGIVIRSWTERHPQTGSLELHRLYRLLVQYLYDSLLQTDIQLLRSEGFTLFAEIRDVEFELGTQFVAHHLLLETGA